jgi:hypothetical protein
MSEGQQSRRVTLPIIPPVDMTVTALASRLLPWQMPGLWAIRGRPADDPTKEIVSISFEWPIPHWASFSNEVAKEALERLHIERCCTDHLLAHGQPLYTRLDRGDDPPDFVAAMPDGTSTALDATQLRTSARLAAQGQFERIRTAMLEQPRDRIAQLAGHQVYLWFATERGLGLPNRTAGATDEVVDALCAYTPDTSWLLAQADAEGIGTFTESDIQDAAGCQFYAADFREAVPATEFCARTGFELALGFQTTHGMDAAWIELARLVEQKDKPEIQTLIVSVGAPNRRGIAYPSEEFLLDLALQTGLPEIAPNHLESVIVHSWTTGRAIQVYPTPARATGPVYAGHAVDHYPLANAS